jgi:hypothetical protein
MYMHTAKGLGAGLPDGIHIFKPKISTYVGNFRRAWKGKGWYVYSMPFGICILRSLVTLYGHLVF